MMFILTDDIILWNIFNDRVESLEIKKITSLAERGKRIMQSSE